MNRYIMLGRGFCEKYQSRDEKFPEPKGEGHLVSRLVFFANTPPNMIYLFNYTEYYLEHWLNKYYNTLCLSFSGIFCFYCVFFRNVLTCYKPLRNFYFCYFFMGIPNEFGGLRHARVKKWNTFSQIPRHRGKKS